MPLLIRVLAILYRKLLKSHAVTIACRSLILLCHLLTCSRRVQFTGLGVGGSNEVSIRNRRHEWRRSAHILRSRRGESQHQKSKENKIRIEWCRSSLDSFSYHSCHPMLCYAMRCYAILCYAMICNAMLYCAMLCYAILCYTVQCYDMLSYAMRYCAMLYYAILCNAIL